MNIHYEEIADVARYIENHKHLKLEDQQSSIESILEAIGKYRPVDERTAILEVGVGSGWFQIYCKRAGWDVRGLEISPQLAEVARAVGRRYDVELDIEVGNIEESDIGRERYDVVLASSVFEHVEHWRPGVRKIYDALRPGGVFFFDSTNKFSFTSGEYDFPLYGWLPDNLRYRLRVARQGEDIMKLGIDFHQFTYFKLRSFFREVGFSQVHDLLDIKDISTLRTATPLKRAVLKTVKVARPLKHLVLTFVPTTTFVCVK